MCGILGFYYNNSINISDNLFLNNLKQLNRRGPDNLDFINYGINNHKLTLGHTRLSILDVSNLGNQPMIANQNSLVFNGEIYNHIDLRNKFLYNAKLNSNSDTETLIKLLNKFDLKKTLNLLEGMFAFCYFDKINNKITLVRDRAGEKPLYIITKKNFFGFASDLSAFNKIKGIDLKMNIESIGNYFNLNYIPAPLTIFDNCFKIPPAFSITIDLNLFNLNPFKNFNDFLNSKGVTYRNWWKINNDEKIPHNPKISKIDETKKINRKFS